MGIESEDSCEFDNFENRLSINENQVHAMFQSVIRYKQDNSSSALPIIKPKLNPNV